jgi:hypothetical protein
MEQGFGAGHRLESFGLPDLNDFLAKKIKLLSIFFLKGFT